MRDPLKILFISLVVVSNIQCATKTHQSTQTRESPKQIRTDEVKNNLSSVSLAAGYYHYVLGELSHLNSDSESALRHFQFASQYYPNSDFIKLKEAEQLISVGKVSEAKEILRPLQLTNEPEFFLVQARIASMELDFKSSSDLLDQAIILYRKDNDQRKYRETLLMKVALLSDARMYDESISALDEYLKENPEDEVGFYFQGKILSIQQKLPEAIDAFKKSLALRPNFLAASKSLGLIHEMSEDQESAIEVYQDALFFNNNESFLREKLGNLYLVKEDYAKALEQFQQMALMNPEDVQIQLKTGLLHFKMDQFEEASVLFTKLLSFNEIAHDRVQFYLAAAYEKLGNYESAVKIYQQVAPDSNYFFEARFQASFIYLEFLKSPDRSIQSLQEASRLKPESEDITIALIGQLEKVNRLSDAITSLREAIDRNPESERLLFVLGSLLDKSGDFEASIEVMEKVLDTNPNHAHALNHIGYLYAEKGIHLDRAEELLIKAVQLEPQNAFITDSLGWLYFKSGDFQKAREILEKAVELEPKEPVILEHLADVYMKLGMEKQALDVYRQVVEINEENLETGHNAKEQGEQAKRVQGKIASAVADSSF